ncbi:urease accessory protein UreF [Caulobacter sp. SLTY]|uniref:urease accessory protein UreF n=1 Tax=Caulobacter sp. SLTY TaxID=2683262 RepID=UPI00196B64FB|nr:urease accessory protein UreF [Caulobacter sp. SLTY]
MTTAPLLKLLTWLSPAFPVGGFSYSHGLETVIAESVVHDRQSLQAWIAALIAHGSGWTDAVLLTEAWNASTTADAARIADIAELADALVPSLERRRESLSQGAAFLTAARAWRTDALLPPFGDPTPYCVAVGATAAAHAVPLAPTLTAWLHGFASNLTSIAMRAVPLGQTDGVAVLAALEPLILDTAARAAVSSLDDLGACALHSDIAAMRHETLTVRLFIS